MQQKGMKEIIKYKRKNVFKVDIEENLCYYNHVGMFVTIL